MQTSEARSSRDEVPFPPYELLDEGPFDVAALDERARRAADKTRKLRRLYHQTQAHAWNPNEVLDRLSAEHGGIHVPEDKRQALGKVFTILLWGELAAWNVAADLARWLPDVDARMAATGQVFDEARHFTVLRDYFRRAEIPLPPLNPFGTRLLRRIQDTHSMLDKLYGMQLLVETLALGIFKGVAASGVEPVLSGLLGYIERDEARHVGLGVLYVPELFSRAGSAARARAWAFNTEMFLLTVAGGQQLDPDFQVLGIDHRELALSMFRLHEQTLRQIRDERGERDEAKPETRRTHLPSLSLSQHRALIDFLHPGPAGPQSTSHRLGLGALGAAIKVAGRLLA